MTHHQWLNRPIHARPVLFTVSLWIGVIVTLPMSVRAQTAPIPVAPAAVVADHPTSSAPIPGIPNQPDLVTVVPFHAFKGTPWIMIQAEVDGHRGTFSLDTGSPVFFLNARYLRSSPTGGLDTITAGSQGEGVVTVHTLRVGTLVQHIDSIVTGLPPTAPLSTNAIVQDYPDNGILGNLGLTGLEPFETIIDYVHQRVIFVRLDKAGRRLVAVPAYTPAGTVPLLPGSLFSSRPQHWGIQVHRDTAMDTIIVDTGAPTTDIVEGDQQQAADQLKQAIVTSHNSGTLFNGVIPVHGKKGQVNLLGAQFLSRLGVVGFNLRTHQLILYH